MRRRVAQRLLSGQDVCIFCAFRPAVDTTTRLVTRASSSRGFQSATSTSSSAGAAAARQQDEEADDPPMLRQNSNLANSFPTRRPNLPAPTSTQSQRNTFQPSQSTSNRANRSSTRNEPNKQNGESGFRNNFDIFARRGNNSQPKTSHEPRPDRADHRMSQARNNRDQRPERQPQRFGGRAQFQENAPNEQAPDLERTGFITRRFVPTQTMEEPEETPITISDHSSQRSQRHPNVRDQPNRFRNVTTDYTGAGTSSRDAQTIPQVRENYTPPRHGKEDVAVEDGIDEAQISEQAVVAPAGTSFDTTGDIENFYHHRGHREDKKKSRSARFEDEDEDSETQSTPPTVVTPSSQPARSGVRAKDFDYEMAEAEEALYGRNRKKKKGKKQQVREVAPTRPSIRITEFMSVGQLAKAIGVQLDSFTQRLEEEGFVGARYDHVLPAQDSSMIADLYGFDPVVAAERTGSDLVARPLPKDVSLLPSRPPIVTIMGHVDHGKTTILDYLRKSSVVATEHGGITQHIGAFSVKMPGTDRQITFLDTPGHAAFLEMRRRGAYVTDIVVLVVAADDSVKPQTIEAIKHARGANVQIIVAINKVDKEDANVERVKQDLTRHEIVVEDYGGDFQAIPVSGKTGQGMSDLEEAIITLADVHDYRAETDGLAEGTIIESKVTAAGRVATVLVRRGTLRVGDFIVAGTTWARVRTLRDDTGALVKEAPPGTPVQVDGWRGEDPTAGLEVLQAEDEDQAKDAIDFRIEQRESLRASVDMASINEARSEEAEARAKVLEWEAQQEWAKKSFGRRPKENAGWVEPDAAGGPQQVHFLIKGDVAGSVEAVVAAVSAVGNKEVVANVIYSGTGPITESDIRMLATSGEIGYAISFNQPIDGTMYRLAEAAGLQILDHNIIYKVTDTVKDKLAERLPPIVTQKVLGEAEVGQIFDITVKKNKIKIAGCKVTNGTISRANKVRVSRGGAVVYTGTLHSLKNVKKDVTEMRKGTECGMGFEDWDDFREGDQIQCFEEHEEKRSLY